MINARADFNKRKSEINNYFDFLKVIDQQPSSIQFTDPISGLEDIKRINDDLIKMLKANGFILLYNLVESTIENSVKAIFNKVHDDGLTFQRLSEKIKKLWIYGKGSDLKGMDDVNFNRIRDLMRKVADSILAGEVAKLETSCLTISGNLDAQSIRAIANQVGFDEAMDGRHLLTIKTKRNHLAHGEFSFCDIGKDYSINEMIDFKDNAFDHIEVVMTNIEDYIHAGKYVV